MPPTLSRRWITAPPPPFTEVHQIIAAFLQETTITTWTTWSSTAWATAYDHLLHYETIDFVYDDWDEDAEGDPPNAGNLWHAALAVFAITDALKDLPGRCPPTIPFY